MAAGSVRWRPALDYCQLHRRTEPGASAWAQLRVFERRSRLCHARRVLVSSKPLGDVATRRNGDKMRPVIFLAGTALALAQTQIKPVVSQRTVNEQVNIVRLSPRYSTAIRLPEAVSSVVVGDPVKFLAEHSDKEPTLVLVKPASEGAAESNLLVTTVKGTHLSFLLRSEGPSARAPVDFVMNYRSAGSFLVEDSAVGTGEVAGTTELAPSRPAAALSPAPSAVIRSTRVQTDGAIELPEPDGLAILLERQQRAKLPPLYGMRTATPDAKGDLVKVGISG